MITAYTVRHAERVKRLVPMNTLAVYGQVDDPNVAQISDSRWFRWIGAGMESGRTAQVLRNAGSTILSVMRIIGFSNPEAMTDTWTRANP
jgi:haloalkane dehalogenase